MKDGRTDGWWMDGWMDGWIDDGRTDDGRKDGRKDRFECPKITGSKKAVKEKDKRHLVSSSSSCMWSGGKNFTTKRRMVFLGPADTQTWCMMIVWCSCSPDQLKRGTRIRTSDLLWNRLQQIQPDLRGESNQTHTHAHAHARTHAHTRTHTHTHTHTHTRQQQRYSTYENTHSFITVTFNISLKKN